MNSSLPKYHDKITAFLHFFDIHFLELKRANLNKRKIAQEARLATKISILFADEILIPAASFFESQLCRTITLEFKSLFEHGIIWLVGSAMNIEEFTYRKLNQYDKKSKQYAMYKKTALSGLPPFRSRKNSATKDIKFEWKDELKTQNNISKIADGTDFILPKDFEYRWERVPDDLEEKAFIVEYVNPILFGKKEHPIIMNRLNSKINESYFFSYVDEFKASTISDLIYLASPHKVPSHGIRIPYKHITNEARKTGLLKEIINLDSESLFALKNDARWVKCVLTATKQEQPSSQIPTIQTQTPKVKKMEKLRTFIVHGHDTESKLSLKDYLQNTLDFPEPVILHQQPNQGRTVIEKFEDCSGEIDVAFILLTPDDIGGALKGEQKERARQNVIFELGFFVGKFGRKSGRTILLHKGDLEIPSDLGGVIYINISNGIESAGEEIRRELQNITSS